MTDLLPETRAFLRDWLDWVERGAPQGEPYYREYGLCWAAKFTNDEVALRDLHSAFGGAVAYPFGLADFWKRVGNKTQHKCPKRLAWAREHAAEREKSLSHSEGEA